MTIPPLVALYGNADQHVIGKDNHRGYYFLVAYLVDQAWATSRIEEICKTADEQMAPLDAVCWGQYAGDGWKVVTDYDEDDPRVTRWREYVKALEAYEQTHLIKYQVWATTDDVNWLAKNGTPDVLVFHGLSFQEAELTASRVRLLAKNSVVTVKPI